MNPTSIRVTNNRTEWWDQASEFGTAPGRQIMVRGRVVAVDPSGTSPNVIVEIRTSMSSAPVRLRPGESVTFPAEVSSVWVCNPAAPLLDIGTNTGLYGSVVLLSGDISDLVAWRSRSGRHRPDPMAALLAAKALSAGSLRVPTNGLEKLRAMFFPVDAGGIYLAPPADLAGTITIVGAVRVGISSTGVVTQSIMDEQDPATGQFTSGGAGLGVWPPDIASSFAISQTQLVMDYEVGAGQQGRFAVTGLAGTGVAGLWAVIYGV